MTDEELLKANQAGFIPGPQETEEQFIARMHAHKAFQPTPYWQETHPLTSSLFGFVCTSAKLSFSNQKLPFWQGAVTWTCQEHLPHIQMRTALEKGSYLGIYQRKEILAHEAVHAARICFDEPKFEEIFAYMTSSNHFRRVFGPLLETPREGCLFLFLAILPLFLDFWGALLLLGMGSLLVARLFHKRRVLRRARIELMHFVSKGDTLKVLVRMTDEEILQCARGGKPWEEGKGLRWRMIKLVYF